MCVCCSAGVRQGGVLTFLLSDHLGSTSLTTDSAGNVISELRYTAWGEVRTQAGTTSTSYTYTGQYSNTADFGLMYYNARWYDPSLGRFTSADSIVPAGVQGYDRYAYANNNPVRYTDPSGHCIGDGDDWCYEAPTPTPTVTPTSTSTPTVTPTACTVPYQVCVTPSTNTPTTTPTPWKPFGQQGGENIANTSVAVASTVIPAVGGFCFGPGDLSGVTGCGQLVDLVVQGLPALGIPVPPYPYGQIFNTTVVTTHVLIDDGVSFQITPQSITITILTILIVIPIIPPFP